MSDLVRENGVVATSQAALDSMEAKRYEFVCAQVTLHQSGTRNSFTTYVRIASAVIGGTVFLCLNEAVRSNAGLARHFAMIADVMMIGLASLSFIKIGEHMRGRHGNRDFLRKLNIHYGFAYGDIKKVAQRSHAFDYGLLMAIMATTIGFIFLNPLRYVADHPTVVPAALSNEGAGKLNGSTPLVTTKN